MNQKEKGSPSGLGLFDRPIPEGYTEEWTRLLAAPEEREERQDLAVMVFRLGREFFALRAALFEEIAAPQRPRPLPGRGGALLGLVNVAGELVPCVSLAGLAGACQETGPSSREAARSQARIAVIRLAALPATGAATGRDGERFAFPADEVVGFHRPARSEMGPVPATLSRDAAALCTEVFRLGDREVGLLDETRLFAAMHRSLVP